MNSITAIGRLTKDPQVKYTSGTQTAICRFTLAVDRPVANGKEKVTDFLPCILMGKQAEAMEKYVGKGNRLAIEGRLQSGSYQDNKTGNTIYTLDVFCSRAEFIDWKSNNNSLADNSSYDQAKIETTPEGFSAIDEEIPF